MACTNPLTAWKLNGKIVWTPPSKSEGFSQSVELPCGGCIGCRLLNAKEWSVRITHEAQLHSENVFVTLTYAPGQLPRFGSLHYPDFQLFLKRLRKALSPRKIRFFMCGEYGDETKRAHYHAIFFGWRPDDGKFFTEGKSGNAIYTSEFLDGLWRKGHCNWSDFEPGAAEYIARYITKKVKGPDAEDHYIGLDLETGDFGPRSPEFAVMSRRPGIGAKWFDKYFVSDVDHRDGCIINGRPMKVPRYYDKLVEKLYGEPALKAKKRIRVADAREKAARDSRSLMYGREASAANHKARLGVMKRSKV